MSGLAIVGTTVASAVLGGIAGICYGEAVDKSDLPIYVMFTAPAGAVVGAIVGCVVGVAVFA